VLVQVNGKPRERLQVPTDTPSKELEAAALAAPKVKEALAGKSVLKVVVVPNKLVNIVVK